MDQGSSTAYCLTVLALSCVHVPVPIIPPIRIPVLLGKMPTFNQCDLVPLVYVGYIAQHRCTLRSGNLTAPLNPRTCDQSHSRSPAISSSSTWN